MFNKSSKKRKQTSKNDWQFLEAIRGRKLPILTLDPTWHALFTNRGKNPTVASLENQLTELLKQQGKLNDENKKMKEKKKQLMKNIMNSMSEMDDESHKSKSLQGNMIEKINEQVVDNEDMLTFIPDQIAVVNEKLLLETFRQSYAEIRYNKAEIERLDKNIDDMRVRLNQMIMEKESMESYNRDVTESIKDLVGVSIVALYDETHKI